VRKQKYFPLDRLSVIIGGEKKKGRRVVLANGCFDLIHVGHVRYLEESKALGDLLVVALNSDRSVRRLKGAGRPLMKENDRVDILSAFTAVDYVTLFEEDSVDIVLRALKPHVHAKGSDYTQETVPERATVKSYGGEVAITGGPKVRSTSQVIADILLREKGGGSAP
jgi:rfaE bifunctional protein nucleotidyltransferase chain/domain